MDNNAVYTTKESDHIEVLIDIEMHCKHNVPDNKGNISIAYTDTEGTEHTKTVTLMPGIK